MKDPAYIIDQINSPDYESRQLAALAVYSGVIAEDYTRSAVVWNDAQRGTILSIAKGESGILKLAELLSVKSDENQVLLQEIGNRIDSKSTPASVTTSNVNASAPSGKTEAQIRQELLDEVREEALAKARTELAQQNQGKDLGPATETEGATDVSTNKKDLLGEAQAKYKELYDKDVPNPKKNDLEWINKAIDSKNI